MDELFLEGEGTSPLLRLASVVEQAAAAVRPQLQSLAVALAECGDLPPAAQVDRVGRFLEPVFQRLYPNPRERLRDIEQLANIARGYSSRGRFITDLTLDPPASTSDLAGPPLLDEDYLILSTIHSAKGGEWDVVHVIHAADGMIPSDMATGKPEEVEEERRLFYVALTRARDMLYVYFPLRYYRRPRGLDDAHSYAQVTRFLPPEVRTLFEQRATYVEEELEPAATPMSGRVEGVEAYLSRLWRD
jgi:DNA helicase-2/ATP-dependent DNA helicase PcrA